jgi:hypothetical protein
VTDPVCIERKLLRRLVEEVELYSPLNGRGYCSREDLEAAKRVLAEPPTPRGALPAGRVP